MRIDELISFGFPQAILDIWKQSESDVLLPIQEIAIKEGILDGASMVISAPTSSGKTFLSEIAAYKRTQEQKKVIYLAPHKAIVWEKYADFSRKYKDHGILVVASSGDFYEFDQDIQLGRFDIAILTYEKFAMLLVQNSSIANNCGLLVVDEIQMMSDPNRGADLELLLTKFLLLSHDSQIIALSASIDKFDDLDKWLRAKGLQIIDRPIELREGIYLPDGNFQYRELNSKTQGQEKFPVSPNGEIDNMVDVLVSHLLSNDEQVLIFCRDKASTINAARRIAGWCQLSPASHAIDSLQALDTTTARDELIECLRRGVAFHNADLISDERLLIEENFRSGVIKVICSTSTLAMGVNLPAKTVIIAHADKWDRDERTGEFNTIPISVSEYRNMSGRSGRYRFADKFGRSILLAKDQFTYDKYRVSYVGGTVNTIHSTLGKQPIVRQVLDIVVSKLGQNDVEVINFMMGTFAGFRMWSTQEAKDVISLMIRESIQMCIDLGLIMRSGEGVLIASELGKVCAGKKISLDTFMVLRDWLQHDAPFNPFDALYHASHASELSKISFTMSTPEYRSDVYTQFLSENLEELNVPAELAEKLVTNQIRLGYEETKRLKMILVAKAMIDGIVYRDIERNFQVRAGMVNNMCEHLSWILDTASSLAPLLGHESAYAKSLNMLSDELRYGVPSEILPIARLRVPSLNRSQLMQLLKNGYSTTDKILDTDLSEFQGVISRKMAISLQERIQQSIADSLDRRKREQQVRLQRLGVDAAILIALYEQTGVALEVTLRDLFSPPFCSLPFERITKQREGEPDNLLHLVDSGLIAFSVTARENQNVSMKKAGELIAGAARFKPIARVVVGRPDFHELAIKNADEIVGDGTNFKLLPVYVLAEMYVRVREGFLTEDDVIRILKEKTGYLNFSALDK